LPATAVIVSVVHPPCFAEALAVSVSVDAVDVVAGVNVTVTPCGRSVALRATLLEKALSGVIATVYVTEAPRATV